MVESTSANRVDMTPEPRVRPSPNVIVFGDTGVGKSSILNMLEGESKAIVSDQATGVTFSNACYVKSIKGATFRVLDTVGLNEGIGGTTVARDAIRGLYQLIRQLEDGVNLLVCVMRAPRVPHSLQRNYEMFFEILCDRRVPIVIIVTGLEEKDDMEQWWEANHHIFQSRNPYETEYEESRKKVERLVYELAHSSEAWKMPQRTWFATAAIRMRNLLAKVLGIKPKALSKELYDALRLYGGKKFWRSLIKASKGSR